MVRLEENLKFVDSRLNEHMTVAQEELLKLRSMEKDIEYQKERQGRTDENVEKIFTLISKLKDSMIEMGYGKQ